MDQLLTFDWPALWRLWTAHLGGLLSSPASPFWLPSLLIAMVPAVWLARRSGARWGELPRRLIPRDRAFLKELPVDAAAYLANSALLVFGGPLLFLITALSAGALIMAAGIPVQNLPRADGVQMVLIALMGFALSDFMLYWTHRLFHTVPLLWRAHRFHHEPRVLTPLTAFRFWPWEQAVHLTGSAAGQGVAVGLSMWAMGVAATPMMLLGVNVFTLVWGAAFSHLRHSHVPMPFPRWLSHVLVSPQMHQVHHSVAAAHHDRNFATAFALWDWLFGTLYIPDPKERFAFGLDPVPAAAADSGLDAPPGRARA